MSHVNAVDGTKLIESDINNCVGSLEENGVHVPVVNEAL